jgi:hypothetical protein
MIDAMTDIFWSTLSPSQALLMLYGLPPPNVKETVKEMKKIFYEKEKMLEKKYIDILEKIAIKYWKGYEHGDIKEVSGKEIDELMKDAEEYMKRLKELREDIEKRAQEKTITETYDNVFKILKHLFGKKTEQQLIKNFEKELINKGRADPKNLHVLKELIDAKKRYKTKKKPSKYEVEDIRKNASYLINQLIEYGQRCELSDIKKTQIRISYGKTKNKHAEIFLTNPCFILVENKIKKITKKGFEKAQQKEFESTIAEQKGKPTRLDADIMKIIKKELGEFDISV